MEFAERLHEIALRCRNLFSNAKLVNCFKKGLPDATRSLRKTTSMNSPLRIVTTSAVINKRFDHRDCGTRMSSNFGFYFNAFDPSPPHTRRSPHPGLLHGFLPYCSSSFFFCFRATDASLCRPNKVTARPCDGRLHGGDPDADGKRHKHFQHGRRIVRVVSQSCKCNAGDNRALLQHPMEVHDLTKQQCDEAMAVFPEDIWNLACWGCRDPGHSLFTCPFLTTAQRIFFAYRYVRHHVVVNQLVAKWYMEKDTYCAGTAPSTGCKPRSKSPVRSQCPTRSQSNIRPVNFVNEIQPDSDFGDNLEEDTVQKKA